MPSDLHCFNVFLYWSLYNTYFILKFFFQNLVYCIYWDEAQSPCMADICASSLYSFFYSFSTPTHEHKVPGIMNCLHTPCHFMLGVFKCTVVSLWNFVLCFLILISFYSFNIQLKDHLNPEVFPVSGAQLPTLG